MKEKKRFDMYRKPTKCKWYLRIVEAIGATFYKVFNNAHVYVPEEVKKLKPPYILLSTHASFMDFVMVMSGIFPHNTGWVASVEEFRRGDWLMFGIGSMPKRKFTHDIVTVKHILHHLRRNKEIVTFYPEARFEFAGINERLDGALGKLCKVAKVPVVMCKAYGNFINSPQWSKHPYRRIRQEAYFSIIATEQDVKELDADELQSRIEKAFEKDEYKWQVERNLHTKCKKRADGLYRILYKCPACNTEFKTESKGIHLWCNECGAKWEMDTLSRLHGVNTDKGFSHIPDWYKWEREEVRKEVRSGNYYFTDKVHVTDYYSTPVGFLDIGDGEVVHDKNGFKVVATTTDGETLEIVKPLSTMYSVHVEYDFLGKGDAFDLATDLTSYFIHLKTAPNFLTKMHFAQEEMYDFYVTEKGGNDQNEANG